MPLRTTTFFSLLLILVLACGCRSAELRRTGYLSDYSRLERVNGDVWSFRDASFKKQDYPFVIVDDVAIDLENENESEFTSAEIREIVGHTKGVMTDAVSNHFRFADEPGEGVARLRVSVTALEKTSVRRNRNPVTRMLGSGRGGAAVEAELVDALTGAQIMAGLRSTNPDDYFSTSGYSPLSDITTAIDSWGEDLEQAIRDWKQENP